MHTHTHTHMHTHARTHTHTSNVLSGTLALGSVVHGRADELALNGPGSLAGAPHGLCKNIIIFLKLALPGYQ